MNYLRCNYLIALLLFMSACRPEAEMQKVRLSSFPAYGRNSGFYLALERGYFQNEGIQLEFLSSFENALAPLEAGEAEVAQVLCSQALGAIEQGANYLIIAVRDGVLPLGTISLPESGIQTPMDYQGKRWGESEEFGAERALLPALAKLTGFDPGTVELMNLAFEVRLPALFKGEVDFISSWWGSGYPAQLLAAREQGVELHFIRWSDYGIDVYGNCLVARKDWLENHPAVAKAFFNAAKKGFEEAIVDPEAAVEAVIALNPEQAEERELILLAWTQAQDVIFDDNSRSHGMFFIDEAKLARTRDLILGSTPVVPIQQTYTNDFLPQK